MPLPTPKPLGTSLRVMVVATVGSDRDTVLFSTRSSGLSLTRHSPATVV